MILFVSRPAGRFPAPVAALSLALCAQAAIARDDGVRAESPWLRETAPGQSAGGGFVTLTNIGHREDRLLGGSSPLAASVEVHMMRMDGSVMRMRPMPGGLALPAGLPVALRPGAEHIMLIGLKRPLRRGETVPVTLRFARAGELTVRFAVQPVTHAGQESGGSHTPRR